VIAMAAACLCGIRHDPDRADFIITTHKLRAPGMTWFRLPLFVWSLYATSVIMILATPVAGDGHWR